jgi:hypothetical protein
MKMTLKIHLRNIMRKINGVVGKTVFLLQDNAQLYNALDDRGTLHTIVEHL